MMESIDPEGYAERVLKGRLESAKIDLERAKFDEEMARQAAAEAKERQTNAEGRIADLGAALGKLLGV